MSPDLATRDQEMMLDIYCHILAAIIYTSVVRYKLRSVSKSYIPCSGSPERAANSHIHRACLNNMNNGSLLEHREYIVTAYYNQSEYFGNKMYDKKYSGTYNIHTIYS